MIYDIGLTVWDALQNKKRGVYFSRHLRIVDMTSTFLRQKQKMKKIGPVCILLMLKMPFHMEAEISWPKGSVRAKWQMWKTTQKIMFIACVVMVHTLLDPCLCYRDSLLMGSVGGD